MIYLTLTFFNLGLPVVLLLGFIFLSVRFSGFPYSSICAQKRLTSLVRLGRYVLVLEYVAVCVCVRMVYVCSVTCCCCVGFCRCVDYVEVEKYFLPLYLPFSFSLNSCLSRVHYIVMRTYQCVLLDSLSARRQ